MTIQLKLDRGELELIAHVIHSYEQNFADRRVKNHALGTKIDNAIEDLEMQEYLNNACEDCHGSGYIVDMRRDNEEELWRWSNKRPCPKCSALGGSGDEETT